MKRHFPLHIHIAALFLLLILLVGGLIGGVGYKISTDMLESAADVLTERISRETLGEMQRLVAPAEMAVNLFGYSALAEADTQARRMQRLGLLREALGDSTALSSISFLCDG